MIVQQINGDTLLRDLIDRTMDLTKRGTNRIEVAYVYIIILRCIDEFNRLTHRQEWFEPWKKSIEDIDVPACLADLVDPDSIKFTGGEFKDIELMVKSYPFYSDHMLYTYDIKPNGEKDTRYHFTDLAVGINEDISYSRYRSAIKDLATMVKLDDVPCVSLGSLRKELSLTSIIDQVSFGGFVCAKYASDGSNSRSLPYNVKPEVANILFKPNKYCYDDIEIYEEWLENFSIVRGSNSSFKKDNHEDS